MADDLKRAMAEWLELKHNLAEARKDLSTLNKREKELREVIKNFMVNKEIDTVQVDNKKISVKHSKKTGTLTKDIIKAGLLKFFDDDAESADACFKAIMESIPKKDNVAVTVSAAKA
jgi:coproporphyrinogen III oxidase-like Fe-S oxidoreductase